MVEEGERQVFSLDEVARLLRERHGLSDARVEHTGGGCATIFAGSVVAGSGWFVDRRGEVRQEPHRYPFRAPHRALGDVGDFWFGPDDGGESEPHPVSAAGEGEIADILAAFAVGGSE